MDIINSCLKKIALVFTLSICPSLSFCPSVCRTRPSVDRIMSALYLQQYSSDPFHMCTSYQTTSESVSSVKFVSKFKSFKSWQILYNCIFIPPPNEVGGGVYWIHLVRPSVRPSVFTRAHALATICVHWTPIGYILSIGYTQQSSVLNMFILVT